MKRRLTTFIAPLALLLALLPAIPAAAAGNAGYTTFDATQGGCLDSPNGINCNNYTAKTDVYMNGGPTGGNGLDNGSYYFAVLAPGSQNGGFVDGATGNLSSPHDAASNRTFTVSGGLISANLGNHHTGTSPNGKFIIQLDPYDDTPNPGGVYILAICKVGASSPSDCKYDAFRIQTATDPNPSLTVSKTAVPSFTRTYAWDGDKAVDKTLVKQVSGNATFTYTVNAAVAGHTDSAWQVIGKITVSNPNSFDIIADSVTDSVDDGGTCAVTGGTTVTVPAIGWVVLDYSCSYPISGPTPPSGTATNTATAKWNKAAYGTVDGSAQGQKSFDFGTTSPTLKDNCATISDTFNGGTANTLGKVCVDGTASNLNPAALPNFTESYAASTFTFKYSRSIAVPQYGCSSYTNTANFVTSDGKLSDTTLSDNSQTVKVCGPAKTGALTMGFWQNKNGQAIITGGASTAGVSNAATWLRQFHPFSDVSPTATPAQLGTYVTGVIKAANASGAAMNAMLKAQMLSTALDVYFSDPALGGNKIGALSPIGGDSIDLTQICKMIDNTAGSATCGGTYENVSSAFGSATSLTVSAMLAYQNTSDPATDAGAVWYGQVKATQQLAKDAFDAINNQVAFAP
jgi:hypothetical protein